LIRRRLKISSRDLQYFAAFVLIVTVVTSFAAYLTFNPPRTEEFYATWILGSDGLTENYYPNQNPNLRVGQTLNWTIDIYNHMGSLQYVVLRVKLMNSTLASPNDSTGQPSPVPSLIEFRRVLLSNETWTVPFVWSILKLEQRTSSVMITELSLNQNVMTGELAVALSGFNFRFVFELWHYDQTSGELVFPWTTAGATQSAWTEIWFNATAIGR
jgi:hypothetical protein